jgi:hypothetical protein
MQRLALVVDRLDARKELRIEEDRILMRGELGRFVASTALHRASSVLAPVRLEKAAARDRACGPIFPSPRSCCRTWGRGIVGDRVDLGDLLLHGLFEGGLEIGILDAVERRRLKRQCAGRVERISRSRARPAAQPATRNKWRVRPRRRARLEIVSHIE